LDFHRFTFAPGDRFRGDRFRVQIDSCLEVRDRAVRVAHEVIFSKREPGLRVGGLQAHCTFQRCPGERALAPVLVDAREREQRFGRQRVARYGGVGRGFGAAGVAREQRERFLASVFGALGLPLRPCGQQHCKHGGASQDVVVVARPATGAGLCTLLACSAQQWPAAR